MIVVRSVSTSLRPLVPLLEPKLQPPAHARPFPPPALCAAAKFGAAEAVPVAVEQLRA